MPSNTLINLTDLQGTSSGGPLHQDLERRLDLPTSTSPIEPTEQLTFSIQGTVSSPIRGITFTAHGEEDQGTAFQRIVSCLLISLMPDDGIEESLSTLKDIFRFQLENIQYRLLEQPTIYKSSGKVVKMSEREELVIAEE